MNILDEDIDVIQQQRLRAGKVRFRKIGRDVGRLGLKDRNGVIPLLHTLRRPTFFTRDHGFYHPKLRHAGYCLVYLDVTPEKAADYTRRFLRHKAFRTQAQRMGKVVRVRHNGLTFWQVGDEEAHRVGW